MIFQMYNNSLNSSTLKGRTVCISNSSTLMIPCKNGGNSCYATKLSSSHSGTTMSSLIIGLYL